MSLTGFSVCAPLGSTWECRISSDQTEVGFIRRKPHRGAPTGGTTIIRVFRIETANAKADAIDPAAAAADYFDLEEQLMRQQEQEGRWAIAETTRARENLGGRPLFSLRFRHTLNRWQYGAGWETAGALHLYYPTDYSQTGRFYAFLISELNQVRAAWASTDLLQVEPVIASLRLESEGPAEGGPR